MSKFILSIDQGTTGTTSNIIDAAGLSIARVNCEFEQIYPKPGWVEHDPEAIWKSVLETIEQVLRKSGISPQDLAGIGISNQRETVVAWERSTGKPVYNAIVWQCRRTTEFCQKLKQKKLEKVISKKTGLVIDPYFSGSKMHWILGHVDGLKDRAMKNEICLGTVDSFLLHRLTGGKVFATDVSNASRTQLMDIETCAWDDELLKIFGVPQICLPEIRSTSEVYGVTAGVPGLPDDIPIGSVVGDQQSALFGQTCFQPGDAKCTFGTGSFILMNTGEKIIRSKTGLLTTVAWKIGVDRTPVRNGTRIRTGAAKSAKDVVYALEGGAFVCGAAVQWLRDGLGFIERSEQVEALAAQVTSSEGVEFVPALTGLGAPYWKAEARGQITGLTRGTTRAHIARATLEAMALQNLDILRAMERDLGRKLKALKVDGGASANNLLMQLQSDYLGCQIDRPAMIETTSLGAAYLAGLAVGFWRDLAELKKVAKIDQSFASKMSAGERKSRIESWHAAVGKV